MVNFQALNANMLTDIMMYVTTVHHRSSKKINRLSDVNYL